MDIIDDNYISIILELYNNNRISYETINQIITEKFTDLCILGLENEVDKYYENYSNFLDSVNTPFIKSCIMGHTNIAKKLINKVDTIPEEFLSRAFYICCKKGFLDIVIILKNKINSNIICYQRCFEKACRNGHYQIMKFLYKNFNINISNNHDKAFRKACRGGHIDIVTKLLTIKPDINVLARRDYAFYWACRNGHEEIVILLIEYGANMTMNNFEGLMWAIYNSHESIIKIIYEFCEVPIKLNITPNERLLISNKTFELLVDLGICKSRNWLSKINEIDECCICYDDCHIKTPCEHYYCKNCIENWLNRASSCPICRCDI